MKRRNLPMNCTYFSTLLFLLTCLAGTLPAQGIFKKLKDKVKEETVDNPKTKEKLQGTLDNRIGNMRNNYDSTSFSMAIALSDNSGLFEYEERGAKLQKLLAGSESFLKFVTSKDERPAIIARDYYELGRMSYANYRFKRAEWFYGKSKEKYEEHALTQTINYPRVLGDIGLLYHTMGKYNDAEGFTKEALRIRQEILGDNSPAYAISLNNLAMLYRSEGKYNEAEKLINEAIETTGKTKGTQNPTYAIMLNNKAMLFQNIGRYPEAIDLLKSCLDISAASLREKSPNYQLLMVNLALLYQETKDYASSEEIYKEAIRLKEKRLGTRNHPDLAHMLNLLASLYLEMGKNEEVEPLLKESQRIFEKKFGEEHPAVAATLSNLGNFYRVQGKISEAEPLIQKSLNIREKVLGSRHPDYARAQEDLALIYWEKGNYQEASKLYKQVIDKAEDFIRAYFPPMSENEKEKYWDQLRPTFLRYYSFVSQFADKDPSLTQDMMEAHLLTKGILLNTSNKIKEKIQSTGDRQLSFDYDRWVDSKEMLARLYTLSNQELVDREINLDSIENATNLLEKSISQRIPDLIDQPIGLQEIQSRLKPGEALLEVINFRKFDRQFTDQAQYMGLVLTPEKKLPEWVLISNGNDLDGKFLRFYRNFIKLKRTDTKSYQNYWAAFDKKLQGKSKVYLSLDGVYHQVSLNTLTKPDGKFLLEDNNFVFLSASRDLLNEDKPENNTLKTVTLLGFPNYGEKGKIPALPGTKVEVDKIDGLLQAQGFQTQKLMGENASEGQIKSVQNPRVLHIATHGFFMEDAVNTGNNKLFGVEIEKARENPLLRSGLMLAKSEQVLSGDYTAESLKNQNTKLPEQTDNGILTAYEAMNLDLSQTELVVLSACETGLGEVKAGEGVYGLQRAFHVAGADALIMSLWTVSDASTQRLMTLFYQNWLQTQDKVSAFRNAQLTLQKEYPQPYFWGAFVLIGK